MSGTCDCVYVAACFVVEDFYPVVDVRTLWQRFFWCRKASQGLVRREMEKCSSTKQCKRPFERSWNKQVQQTSHCKCLFFSTKKTFGPEMSRVLDMRSCVSSVFTMSLPSVFQKLWYFRVWAEVFPPVLHVFFWIKPQRFAELSWDFDDRLIHPEHTAVVIWWCCRDVSRRAS